jgi:hypothetical protein
LLEDERLELDLPLDDLLLPLDDGRLLAEDDEPPLLDFFGALYCGELELRDLPLLLGCEGRLYVGVLFFVVDLLSTVELERPSLVVEPDFFL